jgi:hypothetical protein
MAQTLSPFSGMLFSKAYRLRGTTRRSTATWADAIFRNRVAYFVKIAAGKRFNPRSSKNNFLQLHRNEQSRGAFNRRDLRNVSARRERIGTTSR